MRNIQCPTCKSPHALFWYVTDKDKRELMYRCDKVERTAQNKTCGSVDIRTTTAMLPAPEGITADEGPSEELSPAYAKKLQGQKQHQLILMK